MKRCCNRSPLLPPPHIPFRWKMSLSQLPLLTPRKPSYLKKTDVERMEQVKSARHTKGERQHTKRERERRKRSILGDNDEERQETSLVWEIRPLLDGPAYHHSLSLTISLYRDTLCVVVVVVVGGGGGGGGGKRMQWWRWRTVEGDNIKTSLPPPPPLDCTALHCA